MLEATGIPCGIVGAAGQHVLLVGGEDAERARAELDKYDRENREWPPGDDRGPSMRWSVGAALGYAAILIALDLAQRRESFGVDWWNGGLASAGLIRGGAWWRCITALGLHADVLHLASNLVFGAVFGVMLAQSIGVGFAWLAFVVTGGIGNGLNAWLQSATHVSVGASTAIFGLLGVQAAHDWVRRGQLHHNAFRRWAPIAIGAALLAWLGGDGRPIDPSAASRTLGDLYVALPSIDVGAHALGFAIGLVLGGMFGWYRSRLRFRAPVQVTLTGTALGLFGLAWYLALR